MKEVGRYLTSWHSFRKKCEEKVKNRCHINNKGWAKLRDFHMEQWLDNHPSPFGFMFKLKHKHWDVYKTIQCAPRWYHKTRVQREERFEIHSSSKFVSFPSWKGFLKDNDEI